MKITQAKIYLLKSGRLHPVLVELSTDEGISGLGEAGIAYGVGGTAAAGMIKDLSERFLIGRDPSRIEELWSSMYDHSFWAKNGGAIIFAGISAIEQALWDIKGKSLGVPVYELFGGPFRDHVQAYANGWYGAADTPDEFAKAVDRPLKDGYSALKFYPLAQRVGTALQHVTRRAVSAEAIELAYQRVKAVRNAAGSRIELMIDLSGGLTTDETIRLCRRFVEFDIHYVEEPCDPFDNGALKVISNQIPIPIAVGERIYTKSGYRKIFELQATGIIQPDVGTAGGLMEVKKIAAMAEAYNMRVAPHVCGSSLITAATLQLEANISNFMIHEHYPYFNEDQGYVEVLENPASAKDGQFSISNEPGIGAILSKGAVEPYLWASCI
ncbi:mandelate racemase/muconate lactonizing enzyme family protein [Mesorhizobium sp. M1312]|uniref:mandelate racemase/muconate lactonizing enzyme family protein n=1 Tax=unclassified Mesorhizobium TaxID=325217 RepID=UPI0033357FAA